MLQLALDFFVAHDPVGPLQSRPQVVLCLWHLRVSISVVVILTFSEILL